MEQGTILDYDAGVGSDRPAEEATAVAGSDTQRERNADDVAIVDGTDHGFPDTDETVEFAVTQVDYTIEGDNSDEHPVLHLFGRTEEQTTMHARVYGFRPYFYTPVGDLDTIPTASEPLTASDIVDSRLDEDRLTGLETYHDRPDAGSENTGQSSDELVIYESIRGEDLVKVFGQTPRDVGLLRDQFDHYEADILFPNRLLIDKDITSGVSVPRRRQPDGSLEIHHTEIETVDLTVQPRVHTLDIEVDDRHGFPEDGEETIVCLTSHDSTRDEYLVWLYESPDGVPGPTALDAYDSIGETPLDISVHRFDDEAEMLIDYLDYITETNPDILTGWNFTDFDAPYLIDRINRLQHPDDALDADRLSRVNEVWDSGWGGPDVKGRVVFDLLYAYQRTQFSELDSYRLDAVGEEELGVGKERYTGDIGDLWEENPAQLLQYNLRDVELCVELDRKQDIIPFWVEVASFVGCKLEDATTPGDAVDMYVLHKIHGEYALPSKGQQEGEEYEGGAVFDPISGVKEMVSVLDLKCFSGDTQLATPDGIRSIQEITVGDPVYTLNPDTFECEVKPVVDTHTYSNQYGELHHITSETCDLKVTENHRFLLSTAHDRDSPDPTEYTFTEYRSIPETDRCRLPRHTEMAGATHDRFHLTNAVESGYVVVDTVPDISGPAAIPANGETAISPAAPVPQPAGHETTAGTARIPIDVYREHADTIEAQSSIVGLQYDRRAAVTPASFRMEAWLALVGWVVTCGHACPDTPGISFQELDDPAQTQLTALIDQMELPYTIGDDHVTVPDAYLHDWFQDHCGDLGHTTHLPAWVFDLAGSQLNRLLDAIIDSGGDRRADGRQVIATQSPALKSDIVRLAIRCGELPTVNDQPDGTWHLILGSETTISKADATVESHDGRVHCLTAKDNHVVLAGRNGHFQWVGQSLYPMCMVTINASPETKVDPAAYDGETYVAPNDTHFRKQPDGVIREMVDELLTEREQKKSLRDDHDPGTPAFETYDRQQSAVKVIMNCFTPDTDVLTPDGVRNIRDLAVGDEVYSLDPATQTMAVKPVVETHAYPEYRGPMIDIQTATIDFSVTPNHRMLVQSLSSAGAPQGELSLIEADDLDADTEYMLPHDWQFNHGPPLDTVTLSAAHQPTTDHPQSRAVVDGGHPPVASDKATDPSWRVNGDVFLRQVAWYLTADDRRPESIPQPPPTSNTGADTVNAADIARPAAAPIPADTLGGSRRRWLAVLEQHCGASSSEFALPDAVFEASAAQKQRLFEMLFDRDDDQPPATWTYTTTSQTLRDDLLQLCAQLGHPVQYTARDDGWQITVSDRAESTFQMTESGTRRKADSGVYCVSVQDHQTLLAGRNGNFQFVGNSLYGVLGWDRFRLYDREMGAAVTATGREVIEFTEQAASDLDKDVIYGDTDSVMLELGGDISKDDAIAQSFQIEDHINDAYDDFALDRLDAEFHRFEIEFEKLYRRFFQAGKKKRYAGKIIWKEGKDVDDIDITGFEYKRSDIAPITKEVQQRVLEMIVTGDDTEDIKSYIHDVIERVQAGDVSLEELGIPGGIGKKLDNYDTDTAQVRGAKYANLLLGTNFASGSKPKRVYLEKVHPDFFEDVESERGLDPADDPIYGEFKRNPDVICFEYEDQVPASFDVDYEKMLEKTLKGPIARVLEALDISWDEVKSGQEQTGLGSFM